MFFLFVGTSLARPEGPPSQLHQMSIMTAIV
jgi:hypothetical protein